MRPFLLSISIIVIGCSSQSGSQGDSIKAASEAAAKDNTITANTVIENTSTPSTETVTLTFTEDLRIQGDDDEYILSGVNPTVSAGVDGNIYVTDPGSHRIIIYAADGQYLREFGGQGEGPGEFPNLISFTIFTDGSGIALGGANNMAAFNRFDEKLDFVDKSQPQDMLVFNGDFSKDGSLFAGQIFRMIDSKGVIKSYREVWQTDTMEILYSIPGYSLPLWDGQRADQPRYVSERAAMMIESTLSSRGVIAFDADNNVYTGRTGEYEITKWNSAMTEKLMVIKKEWKPQIRSEEEIETFITDHMESTVAGLPSGLRPIYTRPRFEKGYEMADIKPYHNPVAGLIAMPEGKLLVVTRSEAGTQTADLYDEAGNLIGEVTMDHYAFISPATMGSSAERRMVFENGFAYTVETDPSGDHQVVRYRYELVPVE